MSQQKHLQSCIALSMQLLAGFSYNSTKHQQNLKSGLAPGLSSSLQNCQRPMPCHISLQMLRIPLRDRRASIWQSLPGLSKVTAWGILWWVVFWVAHRKGWNSVKIRPFPVYQGELFNIRWEAPSFLNRLAGLQHYSEFAISFQPALTMSSRLLFPLSAVCCHKDHPQPLHWARTLCSEPARPGRSTAG